LEVNTYTKSLCDRTIEPSLYCRPATSFFSRKENHAASLSLGWIRHFFNQSEMARSSECTGYGEHSARTSESLRMMAGLHEVQGQWDKAEPYLFRAVRANESDVGQDDAVLLIPLWGLCDLYDHWNKQRNRSPAGTERPNSWLNKSGPIVPGSQDSSHCASQIKTEPWHHVDGRMAHCQIDGG